MLPEFQKNQIEIIEEKLNYSFKNKALLLQALTRKSFTVENPGFNDNEVLEFLGDKILSFILAKEFSERFGELKETHQDIVQFVSSEDEGSLTTRHSALTKNASLIEKMQNSGLLQYVQKSKKDSFSGKSEGDILESLLGAVALDSNWDIAAIKKVTDAILQPQASFNQSVYDQNDFVNRLNELCLKENIECSPIQITKTTEGFVGKLTIQKQDKIKKFKQKAKSKRGAELSVARRAIIYIKLIWLLQIVDEWMINPLSQLQELKNENLIKEYSLDGKLLSSSGGQKQMAWSCNCTVTVGDKAVTGQSRKTQALKYAKYDVARRVMPEVLLLIKRQSLKGQGLLKMIMALYQ